MGAGAGDVRASAGAGVRRSTRDVLLLAGAVALLWWLAFMFGVDWGKAIGRTIFA